MSASYEGERILCVFNLSRQAQAVEIDLSRVARRGADRADRRRRLPAGRRPALSPDAARLRLLLVPARRRGRGAALARAGAGAAAGIRHAHRARRQPRARARRRRRAAAPRALRAARLHGRPALVRRQGRRDRQGRRRRRSRAFPATPNRLLIVDVETGDGEAQRYFMPLSVLWGEENLRFGAPKLSWTLAKIRNGPKLGAIIDASYDERFHPRPDRRDPRRRRRSTAEGGQLRFDRHRGAPRARPRRRRSAASASSRATSPSSSATRRS